MVLDNLGGSLRNALKKIASANKIDKALDEAVREIQRALLQADVNVKLVMQLSNKSNCVRPPHPNGWGMLRAASPHARIYGILKSSSLRCPDPLDPQDWISAFGFPWDSLYNAWLYQQLHFLRIERTCRLTIGFDPNSVSSIQDEAWTTYGNCLLSNIETFDREVLGLNFQRQANMIRYNLYGINPVSLLLANIFEDQPAILFNLTIVEYSVSGRVRRLLNRHSECH
jgi:hypothetical protein